MIYHEDRTNKTNRAVAVVATGPYNQFVLQLITSAHYFFRAHVYLFTDEPEKYKDFPNVTIATCPHLGWPRMPLLRFELLHRYRDIFKEDYIFILDAEAEFRKKISNSVLDHRTATLHRNIMRFRDEYNYEKRESSTAYIAPTEGEKYYACGFIGGKRREFLHMLGVVSENIRTDISNGIRARWGDESHINRYLIDNRPTTVLPPCFMLPEGNPYFTKYIVHRHKEFKKINKPDTDRFLTVDPADYENPWTNDVPNV
jgi:hypothetical protein